MFDNITDFVTFSRFKNGKTKITQTISQEANIYKCLKELGYRYSTVEGKILYYQRKDEKINLLNLTGIKSAFYKHLEKLEFASLPEDCDKDNVIEWFYRKTAVKEAGFFKEYLKDKLTQNETHQILLETNHEYAHNFSVQQLIKRFQDCNFSSAIEEYYPNNKLYFKKINENKFLVFNHFNAKEKGMDGFDCWISEYRNAKQIGLVKPSKKSISVKLSFKIERDFDLVKEYF